MWNEERHGSDKGYRHEGGAYVGRSAKKFWRVWIQSDGAYTQQGPSHVDVNDAKRFAESLIDA